MNYKFNINDTVKVVRSGTGVTAKDIGKIVTIIEQGIYGIHGPGYKVDPPIGNSKTGSFNYMIGESSFEAAYQCLPIPDGVPVIKLRVIKDIPANISGFTNPSIPKDIITWLKGEHIDYQHVFIENNRWRTNFPKEYFEEIKEESVPVQPIKQEIFEGIFIDDIIVSLEEIGHYRKVGDIFKVLPNSSERCLYYLKNTNSYDEDGWRKATEEEKWWYENKKIKNISEIYKIGDKVKNITIVWNSGIEKNNYDCEKIGIEGTIRSGKFYEDGVPCYSVEWVNGKLCGKDATQLEKISEFSKPVQQSKPEPKFKVGETVKIISSSADTLGIGWWNDTKDKYENIDGVGNKTGFIFSSEFSEEKQMWYYGLDCFISGKVAEYALFIKESKPTITKQPLEVFEKELLNLEIPQDLLNAWGKLNNKYDSDTKSYYNIGKFVGDRTIIKVSDSITNNVLFQVSGTADSIWLRAEGFKAFYDAEIHKYKKPSNIFKNDSERWSYPVVSTSEPKLTPAQKLGLVEKKLSIKIDALLIDVPII